MNIDPAQIISIGSSDTGPVLAALLDLNNLHQKELSLLDKAGLQHLLEQACFSGRIGLVDAFLICLDQNADHDGVNFHWFKARYDRFVYVDRIVVSSAARGRGLARILYERLIAQARLDGHDRIVCEVNCSPPNPESDAFHASFGFLPVGEAAIHGGAKTVRYLSLALEPAS